VSGFGVRTDGRDRSQAFIRRGVFRNRRHKFEIPIERDRGSRPDASPIPILSSGRNRGSARLFRMMEVTERTEFTNGGTESTVTNGEVRMATS
jgi:hypothetical protein